LCISTNSGPSRIRRNFLSEQEIPAEVTSISGIAVIMVLAPDRHVTRWWSNQPPVLGYWGPSTSSIDWCEANYAITRFIAEFTNTLSNLVFVSWAV